MFIDIIFVFVFFPFILLTLLSCAVAYVVGYVFTRLFIRHRRRRLKPFNSPLLWEGVMGLGSAVGTVFWYMVILGLFKSPVFKSFAESNVFSLLIAFSIVVLGGWMVVAFLSGTSACLGLGMAFEAEHVETRNSGPGGHPDEPPAVTDRVQG